MRAGTAGRGAADLAVPCRQHGIAAADIFADQKFDSDPVRESLNFRLNTRSIYHLQAAAAVQRMKLSSRPYRPGSDRVSDDLLESVRG